MHPPTILIVDDDRLLRESLGEILAGFGCQTCQAGSAGGAIEVLRAQPCNLLLSDVDMPDMSGFELLSWVQGHPLIPLGAAAGWQLPVVLMSARADRELARAALCAGAKALLPKPVEIGSLTTLVHQLLER